MKTIAYIIGYMLICIAFGLLIFGAEELIGQLPIGLLVWTVMPLMIICFIGSLVTSLYWFFKPNTGCRFFENHETNWILIHLGASITCCGILYLGTESLLCFIPEEWGWQVDGEEFESLRFFLALAIAIAITVFLFYVFYNFVKMRCENKCMKISLKMEEEKKKIKHLTESSLREKTTEFQQRREELKEIFDLSPEHSTELSYVEDIIYELEKRIRDLDR